MGVQKQCQTGDDVPAALHRVIGLKNMADAECNFHGKTSFAAFYAQTGAGYASPTEINFQNKSLK